MTKQGSFSSHLTCQPAHRKPHREGRMGAPILCLIINGKSDPGTTGSSYHPGGSTFYQVISALRLQIPSDTIPLTNSRTASHVGQHNNPPSGQGKRSQHM